MHNHYITKKEASGCPVVAPLPGVCKPGRLFAGSGMYDAAVKGPEIINERMCATQVVYSTPPAPALVVRSGHAAIPGFNSPSHPAA